MQNVKAIYILGTVYMYMSCIFISNAASAWLHDVFTHLVPTKPNNTA